MARDDCIGYIDQARVAEGTLVELVIQIDAGKASAGDRKLECSIHTQKAASIFSGTLSAEFADNTDTFLNCTRAPSWAAPSMRIPGPSAFEIAILNALSTGSDYVDGRICAGGRNDLSRRPAVKLIRRAARNADQVHPGRQDQGSGQRQGAFHSEGEGGRQNGVCQGPELAVGKPDLTRFDGVDQGLHRNRIGGLFLQTGL